jgi:hypothetical protein
VVGHKYKPMVLPVLDNLVPNAQLKKMNEIWEVARSSYSLDEFFNYFGRVWALTNFEIEHLVILILFESYFIGRYSWRDSNSYSNWFCQFY